MRTRQINRLRALLLTGEDADRLLSRGALTEARLAAITRRRGKTDESVEQAVRRAEARRLALAIRDADRELKQNKQQLADLVDSIAPGLRDTVGVGQRRPSRRVLVALKTLPQRRRLRRPGRR